MSVVKLSKKEELDKLVASLTLRLGRKISQQSVIDACIHLSTVHIDELESYFIDKPHLSKNRVLDVLALAEDFEYEAKGSDDNDIYGE